VKSILCFVPALLSLFVAAEAFGQTLWQNATYGMSIEDVLHKIPATEHVIAGQHLGTDAVELASIPRFEFVDSEFTVHFYFFHDKLTQVTLELDRQVSYATARGVFDRVLVRFRTKYGRERLEEKQAGPLASSSADWLSGQTKINVTLLGLPGTPPLLNVNYQAQLGSEASKP
jgi:hypothetical protein